MATRPMTAPARRGREVPRPGGARRGECGIFAVISWDRPDTIPPTDGGQGQRRSCREERLKSTGGEGVRYLTCIGIGVLAGIFSGLFGVGGGVIAIPLLAVALAFPQHLAQGTAAFMIIPTVAAVGLRYLREGEADVSVAAFLALGSVPFGFLAASFAQKLSDVILRRGFALLLVGLALQLWFGSPRKG